LDTTPPSTPVAIYPIAQEAFNTGTIALNRSGSSDAGAGMSGYRYEISTGDTFDIIYKT